MRLDESRTGRPASDAAVAAQWFSQDVFAAAPAVADASSGELLGSVVLSSAVDQDWPCHATFQLLQV